ncbi:MAG: GNAT family N-acetyltransferase, partial [Clostridiales bacterium]|nr:GNAT family N-acetyltransferase [Clostridiales bacterium]
MIEMTEFVIKTIAVPDVAVLDEFLYHAVFIPPNEKPIAREIIYTPEIYVYAEEFGKPDDIFVAAIVGEKT